VKVGVNKTFKLVLNAVLSNSPIMGVDLSENSSMIDPCFLGLLASTREYL
jgi:hypothetical protein